MITLVHLLSFNPLFPRDALLWHRSGLILAEAMVWCLIAPSHYLSQYWFITSVWFTDNQLRAILWERPKPSNTKISLKIAYSKFCLNLLGTDVLTGSPFLPPVHWTSFFHSSHWPQIEQTLQATPNSSLPVGLNTLRPTQNGCQFPDDIFKWIFLNENAWISTKISLKFVSKVPINNIPALVQIMAWRRPGDKPLSEPMMARFNDAYMRHSASMS